MSGTSTGTTTTPGGGGTPDGGEIHRGGAQTPASTPAQPGADTPPPVQPDEIHRG